MQLPFQLMVHIGAHTLLCAKASWLPKISTRSSSHHSKWERVCPYLAATSTVLIAKHPPLEAGGSSCAQPLCCCSTSITNQFDLKLRFQPTTWITLVYMFKTTKWCYFIVLVLLMLPRTVESSDSNFAKASYICYIIPSKQLYIQVHLLKTKTSDVSQTVSTFTVGVRTYF